jgi:hypothetical protein
VTTFGIITAVSREENIPAIHRSIVSALKKSKRSTVRWILVISDPGTLPGRVDACLERGPKELTIQKTVYPGGRCIFGIAQKNMAHDVLAEGSPCFQHVIDDDNIVHPDFFDGIEKAVLHHPSAGAFVFGQKRWDGIGDLTAARDRMRYGAIDSAMFAVDTRIVGPHRHNFTKFAMEDFDFFNTLYQHNKEAFAFLPRTLCYYNFLREFPDKINHTS